MHMPMSELHDNECLCCHSKVGFGDILDKEGKASEAEFVEEFGADRVFYQTCDITSDLHVQVGHRNRIHLC